MSDETTTVEAKGAILIVFSLSDSSVNCKLTCALDSDSFSKKDMFL
jgi:hypothetical protein